MNAVFIEMLLHRALFVCKRRHAMRAETGVSGGSAKPPSSTRRSCVKEAVTF